MTDLHLDLPNGCVVEIGPVANYPLLKEEARHIETAHPKRQRQFASGRHFARLAMMRLARDSAQPPTADTRALSQGRTRGYTSHSEALPEPAPSMGLTQQVSGEICGLAELAAPIGRDDNGLPIWPAGVVGSISHSECLAAAAVSTDLGGALESTWRTHIA